MKNRKYLKIIAAIALILVILGAIFNINTYLMSAAIGIFVSSIAQIFIHGKRTS